MSGRSAAWFDTAPVGEQFAGVFEGNDTVTQQAPALFRVGGYRACCFAICIICVRATWLMLTHRISTSFCCGLVHCLPQKPSPVAGELSQSFS